VSRGSDGRAFGLRIVKPHGPVVRLTCARDIRCPDGNRDLLHTATLGPGGDEITIASGGHAAEVVGYDGTLRRTIDLDATSTNAGRGRVGGLRWSADGRNLAVATYERARDPEAVISRVWLVDGQDTHVRLVLSLLFNEPFSRGKAQGFESWGAVWGASGWGFSPDGQSLLLDVETGMDSADVVVLHLQPEGAADPVVARTLYHSDRNFDWAGNVAWSPDGARIAVRTAEHIVEISADDGRVLARHPHRSGWLIWTTGDPR
jgi:hypothetical protein